MNTRVAMLVTGLLVAIGVLAGVGWWKVRNLAQARESAADSAAHVDRARETRTTPVALVAPTPLPTGLPLLGADGDASSAVDRAGLRSLLAQAKFADLTRYLERLQADFEADPSRELLPMDAGDAFASAEPELLAPLDAWAAAAPGSFAPYLARAAHWESTAYARRGGKFVQDTAEADLSAMHEALERGLADAGRALALRPKLVAARRLQILLDRATSRPGATREAIDAALVACPTCFQVRVTYLYSLTPRWGGSYQQMDAFARAAADPAQPRLGLLAGYADEDRADVLRRDKRLDEARAAIERATALGERWEFLVQRAKIDAARGDRDHAVADLDRALALRPRHPEVLFERAWLAMDQKRWEAAGQDLLAGLRIVPTNDTGRAMHHTVVTGLVQAAWQAHQAGEHAVALRRIDLAAELGPGDPYVQRWRTGIVSGSQTPSPADPADPLEQAVRDHPDDFRAHQQLDLALARKGERARIVTMWTDYLARHPDDGPAYLERGGTYYHTGHLSEARADVARACELGVSEGCVRKKQLAAAPAP